MYYVDEYGTKYFVKCIMPRMHVIMGRFKGKDSNHVVPGFFPKDTQAQAERTLSTYASLRGYEVINVSS